MMHKVTTVQHTLVILWYVWKVFLLQFSLNINQLQPDGLLVNINPGFSPLENLEESPLEPAAEGKHNVTREIFVDLVG